MKLIEFSDATTFLERAKDFLLQSEAENNLLLSSAWTLARNSIARQPHLSFFVIESEHKVVGAALNSTERRLLLSVASPEVGRFLGEQLTQKNRSTKLRGVLGPSLSASAFTSAIAHCPRELTRMQVMRLQTPVDYAPTNGLLRVAKEKDKKLLFKWSRQFVAECGLDETQAETEEVIRRYLENRQLFIWEDSRPVAMAGYGGITPNGVRVNMVYTDPTCRGRGYAGSIVHILSRRLLSDGHRFCFLFTDTANPVSGRVYERLGYRSICDFIEYRV